MRTLFTLATAITISLPAMALQARPVDVLLSTNSSIYEEALAGIRMTLREHEVRTHYLNILSAENRAGSFFQQVEQGDSAMVIAVGPAAARSAIETMRRKPVVVTMVNAPRNLARPGKDLCGVSMDIPISVYFSTINEVDEDAFYVHSFYSNDQGEFLAGEGEYFDLRYQLSYTKHHVESDDFEEALQSIRGQVDAIYLIPDPLYNRQRFQIVSEFARENNVMLMTGFETLVKLGATFGYSPDHNKIGLLTGEMANRILSRASTCEDEGIALMDQASFLFNLNEEYARRSGVELPESIVTRAQLVRLTQTGVKFFNEGKLNSSRSIFEAILRRDPQNATAQYYQNEILNQLTGDRIRELLDQASSAYDDRLFARSRDLYATILRMNPNVEEATEGLQKSRRALSEQQRQQALALEAGNQPYEAIKMLQAALTTLPANELAQGDLNRLRAGLQAQIPAYFDEGRTAYEQRNYPNAIGTFENILLVQPGNQQAQEYLRLSRLKQDAMARLRARQN